MTRIRNLALTAALSACALSTHAGLVDRGNGLIYDTTLNITWLADLNYAATSGYMGTGVNANGTMTWAAAGFWADALVYGGYSDWRLPTLNPSDTTCSDSIDRGGSIGLEYVGTGCTGGELSHLFVADLGNEGSTSVLNQDNDKAEQIANLALFSNVQSVGYWSGTEYALDPVAGAWRFRTSVGNQNTALKFIALSAVAVRAGDVAAAVPEPQTVPEPQSLALVLLALGAAVVARRRRTG